MLRAAASLVVLGLAALLSLASGSSTPPPAGPPAGPPAADTTPPPAPEGTYRPPQTHRFQGGHPVHPDFGRGYCREAGTHAHDYAPLEPELFTLAGGVWIFVGDPGDFEYEGDLYWYANPHPIPGGDEECWCYYPWPHRHDFALDLEGFDLIAGLIYYVGEFTAGFYRDFEHKREFFRRHYHRRYHQGSAYRHHRPRYERRGPGQYRLVRHARPFEPYRPDRPRGDGPYTHAPGSSRRPFGPGAQAASPSRITRGHGVRVRDPGFEAHRGMRSPAHLRTRPPGHRWLGPTGRWRHSGWGAGLLRGARPAPGYSSGSSPARRSSGSSSRSRSGSSRSGGGSRRR